MLATEVLSADSFNFSPAFLRRMTVSTFDIDDAQELGRPAPPLDLSIDQQVLGLQRGVLDTLMSPSIAQRLLNNAAKVDDRRRRCSCPSSTRRCIDAVWSELKTGKDITLFRRNLQREYATRVANALVRPRSRCRPTRARCCASTRRRLRAELAQARRGNCRRKRRRTSPKCAALLDEAQKAPLVRQAV